MGLTQGERDELNALASNIRDDRLRMLVFKLLEATEVQPVVDAEFTERQPPRRRQ